MTKPVIAMPVWRSIENATSLSLMKLAQGSRYDFLFQEQDSLVPRARARLVSRFLRKDSDVLVFVDSDIVFEPADMESLVHTCRHWKSVVGAAVSLREDGETNVKPFLNQPVVFGKGRAPCRVEAIGTTMMAIHRDVFLAVNRCTYPTRELPDEEPFWPIFEPFTQPYMGEDFSFCWRARDAGFDIWCLPSLDIGHIGTKEFRIAEGQEEIRLDSTFSTTAEERREA